jgi:pimeloyl-ACP methyl ester carboxylesterase
VAFRRPACAADHRTVLFDHVGAGGSDRGAYDPARYGSLAGYADDVVEICRELGLVDAVFVGHSVSAMIGAGRARTSSACTTRPGRSRIRRSRACSRGAPPRVERFGIAALYQPANAQLEVGGDWHDAFTLKAAGSPSSSAMSWGAACRRPRRWASCAARCARWRGRAPDRAPCCVTSTRSSRRSRRPSTRRLAYAEIDPDSGAVA